jgi:hypothetical protein
LNDGENSAEGTKLGLAGKDSWTRDSFEAKASSNFDKNLQDFVDGYKPEGKGHTSIEKSPFQATRALLSCSCCRDRCQPAIISGGSDFCVYVGPNGRSGLADIKLKDF